MNLNPVLLEWIGYVGSVVVAISLTMSSIKKLRWYNLLGAAIFSFYGFSIGALPVGFLNLFITIADVYYLYKMYSFKESFKAISIDKKDAYLHYFISYYNQEIKSFFPDFKYESLLNNSEKSIIFLLLRNSVVAGVFWGTFEDNKLQVQLDFVTPEYRDLKPGDFIYSTNLELFKSQKINQISCQTNIKTHQKYLVKMGFKKHPDKSLYTKII